MRRAMRLLIRGGSIAAGHGVARSSADILKDRYGRVGVEVINRSCYRHTSFDGIRTFYEDIDSYRPELLLLHFGIDDAFSTVYRSEFKENLVQIVRLTRARFESRILLATSQVFDKPDDMDAVNIYYRTIREVAVDLNCVMIPVHTYWAGYLMDNDIANTSLLQADTRYPNELGHAVIAEAVIQTLDLILNTMGINQDASQTESRYS
jgi:hypothetical protein